MSEQALDLRRSLQVVRRHRIQVGAIALVGLLAGAGYAAAHPPPYRSETLVLIAESGSAAAQATTPSGVSSQIATNSLGIAAVGTVLFDSLGHGFGPAAFVRAADHGLLVAIGFLVCAAVAVLWLPKHAPER